MALTKQQMEEAKKFVKSYKQTGTATKVSKIHEERMNRLKGVTTSSQITTPGQPQDTRSLGRKAVDLFTSSEQKLGQTFGDALAVYSKDYKEAAEAQVALDDMNVKVGKAIVKLKKEGKDTSRLEKLYQSNTGMVFEPEKIAPSITKSAKQIYGEGLGVATDIVGAGSFAGGAKALVTKPVNKVFQGVGKGMLGGAEFGLAQGVAGGMQENKTASEIAKQGLTSGAVGAVAGGLLGGITAKIGQKINAAKLVGVSDRKALQSLEVITPNLKKSEEISAIAQGRAKAGGFFQKTKIVPSSREIEIAEATKNLKLKPNKPFENITTLKSEITKEGDSLVSHLKQNDSIFNVNQVNARLNKIEKPVAIASDTTLDRAYDLSRKKMMDLIQKNPKKLSGALQARKEFDSWVENQFGDLYKTEKWTPMRSAITGMRREINDFIAEALPDGSVLQKSLRNQSLMFEAIDNISEKAYKEIGQSGFQKLTATIRKNPVGAAAAAYGTYKAQDWLRKKF
jgi:hypothetical protein